MINYFGNNLKMFLMICFKQLFKEIKLRTNKDILATFLKLLLRIKHLMIINNNPKKYFSNFSYLKPFAMVNK
jgi:hypothetical protein